MNFSSISANCRQARAIMLGAALVGSVSTLSAQCSQPSDLNAANLTPTSTQLTWAAAPGASTHRVQYRIQGTTAWTNVTNIVGTTTTLTGLAETTIYQWRVKGNCSTYSSINLFNSGGSGNNTECSQPSNLNAQNLSTTSVELTWSALPEAFNYTLQYRVTGTTAWTTVSAISGTAYTLNGLLENTTYQWRVKASCSVYSSIAEFNTATVVNTCSPPANQVASSVTTTSANLSWDAEVTATDYTVQYRITGTTTFTVVGPTTATSVGVSGLSENANYEWQVKANCSDFSSLAQFSTTGSGGGTQCSAPSNTNTTDITPTSAVASWEAVAQATSYTVEYRLQLGTTYTTVGTVTTATATITGLAPSTEYAWRVTANCSPSGSDVQFTTTAGPGAAPSNGGISMLNNGEPALTVLSNPVSGNELVVSAFEGAQIQVLSTTGSIVMDRNLTSSLERMDVSGVQNGMYFVRLINGADTSAVRVIIAH
jgi:Fibronectin type III domain/Secretion system C-terminal sorting domain